MSFDYKKAFENIYKDTNSLDIAVNSIITQNGIRDSFLLEPRNFNEDWDTREGKTQKIMDSIKKHTDLVFFSLYQQGYIYTNYDNCEKINDLLQDPYNDVNIAKALGFPCEGIPSIEKNHYTFSIQVEYNDIKNELLTVVCEDESKSENFEKIKEDINTFMNENNISVKTSLALNIYFSLQTLIDAVINEEIINEEIINDIKNQISNIGLEQTSEDLFKPENKNILLVLLYYIKNNPIEIFYPVSAEENKLLTNISQKWMDDIATLF